VLWHVRLPPNVFLPYKQRDGRDNLMTLLLQHVSGRRPQ